MDLLQACDLLEGLIPSHEDKGIPSASHLQKLFVFSLMWSVGALLELDDRAQMEQFLLQHPSKLAYPKLSGDQTMFEFVVDDNGKQYS